MRVLDHVFDDMVVDEVVVRVVLPEGVRDVALETPYDVTRHPDTLHYTYLDTIGRPVITISKANLVEAHIQELTITYTFPRILMLQVSLAAIPRSRWCCVAALYIVVYIHANDRSVDLIK